MTSSWLRTVKVSIGGEGLTKMESITIKRVNKKWQATLTGATINMVMYASTLAALLENIKTVTKDWDV